MIYIDLIWRGDLLLLPWFEWKTSVTVTIYVKTSTEVTIKKKKVRLTYIKTEANRNAYCWIYSFYIKWFSKLSCIYLDDRYCCFQRLLSGAEAAHCSRKCWCPKRKFPFLKKIKDTSVLIELLLVSTKNP